MSCTQKAALTSPLLAVSHSSGGLNSEGKSYLQIEKSEVDFVPLLEVLDKDISAALPVGEHAPFWHQLFNESQMLLHNSTLNEERRKRKLCTIDGLWFWGAYSNDLQNEINAVDAYLIEHNFTLLTDAPAFLLPH